MTFDPAAARRATHAVPGIPRDEHGPVFREPWEAQAFSMALALHQRGVSTWPEWAATLADPEKRAQFVSFVNAPEIPDDGVGGAIDNKGDLRATVIAGPKLEVRR